VNAPGTTCSWCGCELPEDLQVSKEQAEAMYAEEKQKLVREEKLEEISERARYPRHGLASLPLALTRVRRWLRSPFRRW